MKSYNDIGDSFLMSERNIFEGPGLCFSNLIN